MADFTSNYSFQILESGDNFSENNYKFTSEDRRQMDALHKHHETHQHTGASATDLVPDAPSLFLTTTGGNLQAGTTIYYTITLVDPAGMESGRSTEAQITMPAAVATPSNPSLSTATTGGILAPGQYFYAISAYVTVTTIETTAPVQSTISVPVGTFTNTITITLPDLPTGATGFNIYRRAPGDTKLFFLDSVDMTVATPPTEYVDTGEVEKDCDRGVAVVNTTNSTNMVTITYPGATPTVPDGYTWKIYRTFFAAGDSRWDTSLLHHVVEETFTGSGVIDPDFDDTGQATGTGSPPTASTLVNQPSKIDLEDGAEVQNRLPVGHVQAFPWTVQFAFSGTLAVTTGTFKWRCPFPAAYIVECQAALGVGSYPSAQAVIVDVNKYSPSAATPALTTIYTTQANRPRVVQAEEDGDPTVPDVQNLVRGDYLTVDIDQVGGSATPTDEDLVVQVVGWAQFDNTLSDFDWS